jgi:GT2 family glycosyltransferase
MPERPVLSFVVPVRNDAVRLRRCLLSIRHATTGLPGEVVVVDNGSVDHTPSVAADLGAVVVSAADRPVAAVRNAGARAATADLIAFVDADHELHEHWGTAALSVMRESTVSGAGCDYHPPSDSTWVQRMYDRLRRHPTRREHTEWLPSGNLVVRRSVFESIGGFDESLESCEDVDLCRRIRESGGSLVADPSLGSTHHGDPSTLRAVFLSELWRGRDNLRVTLRERRNLRSLAGLGFTLLYLGGLAAVAIGLPVWLVQGPTLVTSGLAVLTVLTVFRGTRLVRAGGGVREALPFAATFDTARALALVIRVRHATRRRA